MFCSWRDRFLGVGRRDFINGILRDKFEARTQIEKVEKLVGRQKGEIEAIKNRDLISGGTEVDVRKGGECLMSSATVGIS